MEKKEIFALRVKEIECLEMKIDEFKSPFLRFDLIALKKNFVFVGQTCNKRYKTPMNFQLQK